jgi:hypothetical protein
MIILRERVIAAQVDVAIIIETCSRRIVTTWPQA